LFPTQKTFEIQFAASSSLFSCVSLPLKFDRPQIKLYESLKRLRDVVQGVIKQAHYSLSVLDRSQLH